MKNINTNNYSWADIIEPNNIIKTAPTWEYMLVILMALIALFIIIKYFHIDLRFKLWLLNFNFTEKRNPRKMAKKLLALLKLERNTTYIEKTLNIKQQIGEDYRLELLKACYANTATDLHHIRTLLKVPIKWCS